MLEFNATPLSMDNVFQRSNDMEVILRGKHCKYVTPTLENTGEETPEASEVADTANVSTGTSESDARRRELALPYIMNSIRQNCRAAIRKIRCPAES